MGLLASLTYLFLFYFTISLIRFLEKKGLEPLNEIMFPWLHIKGISIKLYIMLSQKHRGLRFSVCDRSRVTLTFTKH